MEGSSSQQSAGLSCWSGLQLITIQLKNVHSTECILEKWEYIHGLGHVLLLNPATTSKVQPISCCTRGHTPGLGPAKDSTRQHPLLHTLSLIVNNWNPGFSRLLCALGIEANALQVSLSFELLHELEGLTESADSTTQPGSGAPQSPTWNPIFSLLF